MPRYTYGCRSCGREFDLVLEVSAVSGVRPRCPKCGRRAERVFKVPQVIPDAYPEGALPVTSLKAPENPRGFRWVDSRSGMKRLLADHNAKFGGEVEQA